MQKCYILSFQCFIIIFVTNFPAYVNFTHPNPIPVKYELPTMLQMNNIWKKWVLWFCSCRARAIIYESVHMRMYEIWDMRMYEIMRMYDIWGYSEICHNLLDDLAAGMLAAGNILYIHAYTYTHTLYVLACWLLVTYYTSKRYLGFTFYCTWISREKVKESKSYLGFTLLYLDLSRKS